MSGLAHSELPSAKTLPGATSVCCPLIRVCVLERSVGTEWGHATAGSPVPQPALLLKAGKVCRVLRCRRWR